jgi:spore maturation protein CgeB
MSYYDAFRAAGHEATLFDTKQSVKRFVRPGKIGYQVHRFFPVEAWLRKANKEFVQFARKFNPDVLIAFTGAEVLPGAFAYLRSIMPVKIVWYWADPLPNLTRYIHDSLSLTDLVATYSKQSIDVFRMMGAKNVCFLPFAADQQAHFAAVSATAVVKYELSFVGSWRPEREEVIKEIITRFPSLRYKVSGPYWNRCSFGPLKKIAESKPLYGKDFTDVVQDSLLSLNAMDVTNYPSVNMRFFELMVAGGAQLCTYSPEMADEFIDRKEVLYFKDLAQCVDQIQYALDNRAQLREMQIRAQKKVLETHSYSSRVATLLNHL